MITVKIYYHDTDSGGVVYYANYLKFFEEARTEYFAQKGISIKELADKGVLFVVSRQEVDYKYPAVYGDVLTVSARVSAVSGVRVEFETEVTNQLGERTTKGKTTLVAVGRDMKPRPIPPEIKKILSDPL